MENSVMKVSYYPGCSLEGTAKPFDESTRKILGALNIAIEEIPDWSCCGSPPALKMDRMLSTALAAHNLALAEDQHLENLVIPCPFCFRRLLSAQEEIDTDQSVKQRVTKAIERELTGDIRIHNLVGFLRYTIGLDAIAAKVKKSLKGLRIVPYYGCYLVKPSGITHFDNPEQPVSMDELLEVLGVEVMDWDFKTECCGAGLSVSKTETVCELSGRVIREAGWQKADAIVVACQLCQANLDMRQDEIGKKDGKKYKIPVIYFTQLLGLAFGMPAKELKLNHHLVNPMPMLTKKGFVS
jgi:heterodisulfide reductase subunit B2